MVTREQGGMERGTCPTLLCASYDSIELLLVVNLQVLRNHSFIRWLLRLPSTAATGEALELLVETPPVCQFVGLSFVCLSIHCEHWLPATPPSLTMWDSEFTQEATEYLNTQ